MSSLRREPCLSEFITPHATFSRRLDRIYLDTSAMFGTGDMPDRVSRHLRFGLTMQEEAISDVIQHIELYPPDTVFFLNVWCFGWEDVVKEIARHFGSLVHVDRYKRSIYASLKTDRFLAQCTTLDASSTRFHACDRRHKCDACRSSKDMVTVHMVEMKDAQIVLQREAFLQELGDAAIGEGEWPRTIVSHGC